MAPSSHSLKSNRIFRVQLLVTLIFFLGISRSAAARDSISKSMGRVCRLMFGSDQNTNPKPQPNIRSDYYSYRSLPTRPVPQNLSAIFDAFANGLEPDLGNPEERNLFRAYLASRFGRPSNMRDLDRYLSTQYPSRIKSHPRLGKRLFDRATVEMAVHSYPVPPELSHYTASLIQNAGKAKAKLFEIEANMGVWFKILRITEPALGVSPSDAEDARQNRLAELNEWISPSLRTYMRNSKVAAILRLRRLFDRLNEVAIAFAQTGKPTNLVRRAQVDILNIAGFLRPEVLTQLRSEDAMTRIGGLRELASARDQLAMEFGYTGHFLEAQRELVGVNAQSWFPGNDAFSAHIEQELARLKGIQPILMPAESFGVRQLSMAESPLRSCIGGSDCSSNSYPDFALKQNAIYFAPTDEGGPEGHATLILGRAGGVRVAFVDKLQNVEFSKAPFFLEAVRRIVATAGYRLVFASEDQDHNGLSNDTSLTHYVFKHIQISVSPVGRFKPDRSRFFTLGNGYSRIRSRLLVYEMKPLQTDSPFSIDMKPPARPFRLQGPIRASEVLQQTLNLRNGTEADRMQFVEMVPSLIASGIVSRDEVWTWMAQTLADHSTNLKLRFKIYHAAIKDGYWGASSSTPENPSLPRTLPELAIQDPDGAQIFSQLRQRQDIQFKISQHLALAFLTSSPEQLTNYISKEIRASNLFSEWTWVRRLPRSSTQDRLERTLEQHLDSENDPDIDYLLRSVPDHEPSEALSQLMKKIGDSRSRLLNLGDWIFTYASSQREKYLENLPLELRDSLLEELHETSPNYRAYRANERSSHGFSACFTAGTLVDTPSGRRPIEALRTGDLVLSRNNLTGQIEAKPVEKIFVHQNRQVLKLTLADGTDVFVSPEHQFFDPQRGQYRPIGEFFPGEPLLLTRDGALQTESIRMITPLEGRHTVYNIEVKANHNYFVRGILVHNAKWLD